MNSAPRVYRLSECASKHIRITVRQGRVLVENRRVRWLVNG